MILENGKISNIWLVAYKDIYLIWKLHRRLRSKPLESRMKSLVFSQNNDLSKRMPELNPLQNIKAKESKTIRLSIEILETHMLGIVMN